MGGGVLAVKYLNEQGALQRNPILDHVAAVSVGLVGEDCLLDLDYYEDAGCGADVNVVMTGAGHLVEVQGTAEGQTFDRATLGRLLDLAEAGIAELVEQQKQAIKASD